MKEETIGAPPMVSEDAPSKLHVGEPPFPSQPQPVYPEGEPGDAAEPTDAMDKPAGEAVEEEVKEETIGAPPMVSEDAPSKLHVGEPPFPSQPQPVYPEGEPGDAAEPTDAMDTDKPAGEAVEEEVKEETIGAPPMVSEDSPSKLHVGEPPFPSQPQPVYPEGEPGDAAEPTDAMETDTPAGEVVEEEVKEETIGAPPMVSEDAPSKLHVGEPPFPSQPQPVYPEEQPAPSRQ